jgi:hypothetical protein
LRAGTRTETVGLDASPGIGPVTSTGRENTSRFSATLIATPINPATMKP